MNSRKEEIRKRFDRAATTYDGYADVQQETAEGVCRLLTDVQPRTILELGCGTGGFTQSLTTFFPQASLTCLDFSEAMIAEARVKNQSPAIRFHCADCEPYLAESQQEFDCICANATFQWFQNPGEVLQHIHRCLYEDGLFVASVFGPECLADLGMGVRAVMGEDYSLASPQFLGEKQIHTLCHDFAKVEIVEQVYTRRYETIYDLLRVIKYTGTGGYHNRVPRFNKSNLKKLSDWFMEHCQGFNVQYQVFFLRAEKGK